MMSILEDLSFSGIVNHVDRDHKKAVEFANELANEIITVTSIIDGLKKEMRKAQNRLDFAHAGSTRLAKHMTWDYPIKLNFGDGVRIISEKGVEVITTVNCTIDPDG